jgi:hypothetical protein
VQDDEGVEADTGLEADQPVPVAPARRKTGFIAQFSEEKAPASISGLTPALRDAARMSLVQVKFNDVLANWKTFDTQYAKAILGATAFTERSIVKGFLGDVTQNFRAWDRVIAPSARWHEQFVAADWAKHTFGSTALTSWRMSLAADSFFAQFKATAANLQLYQSKWADDIAWITKANVGFTDWVVTQDATSRLIGEISGKPLGLWEEYVETLPADPDDRVLRAMVATGSAGLGLFGADVLESGIDDTDFLDLAVERVETDVLAPWGRARLRAAGELYDRLAAIDPTVPDLLRGAWEEIDRDGPAAASKAAHCLVEALDRTLRVAAPEDAVRVWHAANRRSTSEFGDRGQVTRPLRVMYLAAQIGGAKKVVIAQYESLTTLLTPLHGRLEGVKHASTADVTAVRSLLLTVEGFLSVLFLGSLLS